MNVKIDSRNPSSTNTAKPLGQVFTSGTIAGASNLLSNEMLAGVQTHKDELISIDAPSQFNRYGRREKSVATLNMPPVTDRQRFNKPQTAEGKRKSYFSSQSNEASSTLNSPRGPV